MKGIPLQWGSFWHDIDNAPFLGVKMDFLSLIFSLTSILPFSNTQGNTVYLLHRRLFNDP